jgi:tripartite-type tricarboxylate transporter receptor subunit TctC
VPLRRTIALAAALAVCSAFVADPAPAQDYPSRPVKVVVPFPAGGGTDALTRFVAKGMERRLGQPFIVENRGGVGTTLGATAVARSEPDGYTIMVGTASTFAVAPGLYKRLAYDPNKDFAPVMLFATVPFVLVVNPSLGVSNVKELVVLAKSKPGELSYASAGVGAVHHIFCELFMNMMGIDMKHVPYRGGGAALNDVVAGHVPIYFADAGPAAPLIRSGQLRALGVTTATRASHLPDVPTLQEAGLDDYEILQWWGILAPAGVPDEIVSALNGAINEVLASQEMKDFMAKDGARPRPMSADEFGAFMRANFERWQQVAQQAGMTADH